MEFVFGVVNPICRIAWAVAIQDDLMKAAIAKFIGNSLI
jgi:hypothetical protein